jgi:diaminohydroxyphosphoribosylaminopyrimidine deaminase/5-amino-6-(5-phosphoribosylamino)uracil reductase
MPIEEITEDEAWSATRSWINRQRAGADRALNSGSDGPIHLLPDGTWRAERPVSAPAQRLLGIFAPLVSRTGPLAIGQLGQSLDGRIATRTGASHYINGEAARTHLHRLRALVDAVVIGVGTLNADDPQLTVRHVEGHNPVRVLLDPTGRAHPDCRLFHDGQARVLHVQAQGAGNPSLPAGIESVQLPRHPVYGIHPASVLEALAERGLRRVLVEGGGFTVSRFLEAGALHRLHLLVAPMLIGSGRPGICLPPIDTLEAALRPRCRVFACGADSLFDLALDAPAAEASTGTI